MKSLRPPFRFWVIASAVAVAITILIPLIHSPTAAQKPMFTDLVTGTTIDSQLDPQAKGKLDVAKILVEDAASSLRNAFNTTAVSNKTAL